MCCAAVAGCGGSRRCGPYRAFQDGVGGGQLAIRKDEGFGSGDQDLEGPFERHLVQDRGVEFATARHCLRPAVDAVPGPNQPEEHTLAIPAGRAGATDGLGSAASRDHCRGSRPVRRESPGADAFQRLVAAIGLGEVGIALIFEVSRLFRRNGNWHRVVKLCGVFRTLIADEDGVYCGQAPNDWLLLGAKGSLFAAELHNSCMPGCAATCLKGPTQRVRSSPAGRISVARRRHGHARPR